MSNFDEKKSRISDLGTNSRSRTGAKGYDSFDRVVGNRPLQDQSDSSSYQYRR